MKMPIDDLLAGLKNEEQITWQRDPKTLRLLSLYIGSDETPLPDILVNFFRDPGEWYSKMAPEDAGKELELLNEVFRNRKANACYRIIGSDGDKWQIVETIEIKNHQSCGHDMLDGKWVCKKINV